MLLTFEIFFTTLLMIFVISIWVVNKNEIKTKGIIEKIFTPIFYYPKKSPEIYSIVWGHRGYYLKSGAQNTMIAYKNAIDANMGIELDIQISKDNVIVCFHDPFTGRLLGIPGRIKNKTYEQLRKYKILNTKETIPTLRDVLRTVRGQVPLLIDVKGTFPKKEKIELEKLLRNYKGVMYFQTSNIFAYFRLKKIYKNKTFYVFNFLRKRFQYVKSASYKKINIPNGLELVVALEENETSERFLYKIWHAINRYETRIKEGDPLLTKVIAHRGIVDKSFPEHSLEGIAECIKKDCIVEIDATWYNGDIKCYHSDLISGSILKQQTSCAEKLSIENSLSIREILENNNQKDAYFVIDIKDWYITRRLEENLFKIIKEVNFEGTLTFQSANPFVVRWLFENEPSYKRGIVCNSLDGVRKVLPQKSRKAVNAFLSSYGKPDYILYDFGGKMLYLFSALIHTIGLPVFVYPPDRFSEVEKYSGYYANIIGENYVDEKAWGDYCYINEDGKFEKVKNMDD